MHCLYLEEALFPETALFFLFPEQQLELNVTRFMDSRGGGDEDIPDQENKEGILFFQLLKDLFPPVSFELCAMFLLRQPALVISAERKIH